MLGAWSEEGTSHILQDTSMYGRHEQWMAWYRPFFKKFKDNVAYIKTSNNDASKPYKLSVNQSADLTNEEFIASRNKFKGNQCSTRQLFQV